MKAKKTPENYLIKKVSALSDTTVSYLELIMTGEVKAFRLSPSNAI